MGCVSSKHWTSSETVAVPPARRSTIRAGSDRSRPSASWLAALRTIYEQIVEHQRVVYTELYDGWPEGTTMVTATFVDAEGETKATVQIEYLSEEARDAAMQPGFEEGFAASYQHLDELLPGLVA